MKSVIPLAAVRSMLTACVTFGVLHISTTEASSARSMLAEVAALEKEVQFATQMGADGKDRYTKKISDLRSRFLRAEDATSEQRGDFYRRLSAISSAVREKTVQTGKSTSQTRLSTGSSRSSTKYSSSRSRSSSSSSRSRSSGREPSSRGAEQVLADLYLEVDRRFDDGLPKPIFANSGPLRLDELFKLRDEIPRFVREYSDAVIQWKKDLSAVRRAASGLPVDNSTRKSALELVETKFPDKFRDLVSQSRETLIRNTVGMLNYVSREYASRERQKDKGQFIIYIGAWNMDQCVQTAWDVADLGIMFEKSFGGSPAIYEQAKKDAKVAAKERTIRLIDRLKTQ
jgi:hypothetical protein